MADLPINEASPCELLKALIEDRYPDELPGGVMVGGLTDAAQEAGGLALMDAGLGKVEPQAPLQWARIQMRFVGQTMADADALARNLRERLHSQRRIVVMQPSNGNSYLIHSIRVTAGPSEHYDSPETREALMFAELCFGTEPVT